MLHNSNTLVKNFILKKKATCAAKKAEIEKLYRLSMDLSK